MKQRQAERSRRSFEERWGHLGDLPNWVLRDEHWMSEAWKAFKDYRKAKGVLFPSTNRPNKKRAA